MASITSRVNLTNNYATTTEDIAKHLGVSNAEVVRLALKDCWGEDLSGAMAWAGQFLNGSPVQPTTRLPVQPTGRSPVRSVSQEPTSVQELPSPDELFAHGA
ncbi:MAG: hypothetical protein AAFY26_08255 [Cyanobacteria bacterium J06638_22]